MQGVEVHVHDDDFPQDARDEEWLPEVGRRGWAVITKDAKIRYRLTEQAALIAGGVRAFILTRGDLTGPEMAGIVVPLCPTSPGFPPDTSRHSLQGSLAPAESRCSSSRDGREEPDGFCRAGPRACRRAKSNSGGATGTETGTEA